MVRIDRPHKCYIKDWFLHQWLVLNVIGSVQNACKFLANLKRLQPFLKLMNELECCLKRLSSILCLMCIKFHNTSLSDSRVKYAKQTERQTNNKQRSTHTLALSELICPANENVWKEIKKHVSESFIFVIPYPFFDVWRR